MPETPGYDQLADRVRQAADGAETPLELAAALERAAGERGVDPIGPLICAFNYDLVGPRSDERRRQHGVFAPMVEWEGDQFPPPLSAIDDEWLTMFAEVADRVEAPIVRARLNDLVWERRFGDRPDQRARAAVEAYLAMRESTEPMVAPDALVRALELSRALGDDDRVAEVAAAMVDLVDRSLRSEYREPGVPLTVVEALVDLPETQRPAGVDLDGLLQRVKVRYEDDPFIVQATIEFLASVRRGQPEEERALYVQAVRRFQDAASQSQGILRVAHLQHALELARQYGLREEMEELRRELQAIDVEALDLKEVSAQVELPTEAIERLIEEVAAGEGWGACLERLATVYGPPSGHHDKNVELIRNLQARSPLMFMIPRVELGPEGTLIRDLRTEEDHFDAALAQHERDSITIWSLIAAQALTRITERHGVPDEEELASFFETPALPTDLAQQLAHGVRLFASAAYDDCAHSLAPRIERAIRELCRRAGVVVAGEPIGAKPGGVRPLGHLLAALEGILDESWRRYLVNTLTEPLGLNLRNRIAHGLMGEAQAYDAAVLIHTAVFLRTLRVENRAGGGAAPANH